MSARVPEGPATRDAPALPKWTTDELILALDLYYRAHEAQANKNHREVLALSELLRRLPLFPEAAERSQRFGNPQGVYMKLMNFRHLHPDHPGVGLRAAGEIDREVFDRFAGRRAELHRLAELIRASADRTNAPRGATRPDPDEEEAGHSEGRITYRVHRYQERSPVVARKAKAAMRKKLGRLECEVCGVSDGEYVARYQLRDDDLFECHHRLPLADLAAVTTTKPSGLAILCPTCHRAIPRVDPLPSVERFRVAALSG